MFHLYDDTSVLARCLSWAPFLECSSLHLFVLRRKLFFPDTNRFICSSFFNVIAQSGYNNIGMYNVIVCVCYCQPCVCSPPPQNPLQSLGFDHCSLVVPYRYNDTVYLAWILKATRDYSYT